MKKQLTLALVLATTLTLLACEDKEKKQTPAETQTAEPAAAAETQEATQEEAATASESQPSEEECYSRKSNPIIIEAVFLGNDDSDSEGLAYSDYRLPGGKEIKLNGFAPDNVKKGDKVYVTYRKTYNYTDIFGDGERCYEFETITSVKKIRSGATTFTDPRDKQIYFTVKIGEQVWMAENLNIEIEEGNSKCYDYDDANCQKYGRIYDWQTATKACPKGWHLPDSLEWDKILPSWDNTAGTQLKAKSGWDNNGNGTDKHGFAALPSGCGLCNADSDDKFSFIGYGSWLWSSTEKDSEAADFRFIPSTPEDPYHGNSGDKSSLYSVRCIKD